MGFPRALPAPELHDPPVLSNEVACLEGESVEQGPSLHAGPAADLDALFTPGVATGPSGRSGRGQLPPCL